MQTVNGYIENGTITSVSLGFCERIRRGLTAEIRISYANGQGCNFGGHFIETMGYEYIKRILETLKVQTWEDLKGQNVRIKSEHYMDIPHAIGHIVQDRWFDVNALWKEVKEESQNHEIKKALDAANNLLHLAWKEAHEGDPCDIIGSKQIYDESQAAIKEAIEFYQAKGVTQPIDIGNQRGTLERAINGALLHAINELGNITDENYHRASKRVIKAIKGYNQQRRLEREVKIERSRQS